LIRFRINFSNNSETNIIGGIKRIEFESEGGTNKYAAVIPRTSSDNTIGQNILMPEIGRIDQDTTPKHFRLSHLLPQQMPRLETDQPRMAGSNVGRN